MGESCWGPAPITGTPITPARVCVCVCVSTAKEKSGLVVSEVDKSQRERRKNERQRQRRGLKGNRSRTWPRASTPYTWSQVGDIVSVIGGLRAPSP
jgi:hypothetical protein